MRRAFAAALMASAFHGPVWAGPLQLSPDASAAAGGYAAPSHSYYVDGGAQRYAAATHQQPYADAPQSNMGGGFIEFLFGGAARPAAVPRAYQPAVPEYQTDPAAQPGAMRYEPGQGYAPSGSGDLAHA